MLASEPLLCSKESILFRDSMAQNGEKESILYSRELE